MATVHFGRLLGPAGFARTVAIKRLHEQYARDPEFVSMFLDEARLAARIRHPNVVDVLDVVTTQGELFLVMEYVHGDSLSGLLKLAKKQRTKIPPRILAAVVVGALQGLHAAHEAKDEHGQPLGIVHRDVSPHNIIVGADGIPRVLDFGVAKAAGRLQSTHSGQLKGKLAYMAPEQVAGKGVDRRTDVWSMAIVLWEGLLGMRLFEADNEAAVIDQVRHKPIEAPSTVDIDAPPEFDEVVMRGLSRDIAQRYPTAREMARAVEKCVGVASSNEISEWIEFVAAEKLAERAHVVEAVESSSAFPALSVEEAHDLLGAPSSSRTSANPAPPPAVGIPSPRKAPQVFAPGQQDVAHAATVVDRTSHPSLPQAQPVQSIDVAPQPTKVVVVQRETAPAKQGGSVIFTVFVLLLAGGIGTVFWLMANGIERIKVRADPLFEAIQQVMSPSASGSASAGKPPPGAPPKK
jgi:serine/threonine-protein kinase